MRMRFLKKEGKALSTLWYIHRCELECECRSESVPVLIGTNAIELTKDWGSYMNNALRVVLYSAEVEVGRS